MSRSTGVHTRDELYNQFWTYTGARTRLCLLVFHSYALTSFHRLARRNVLASLVARRGAYMHAWHCSVLASLLLIMWRSLFATLPVYTWQKHMYVRIYVLFSSRIKPYSWQYINFNVCEKNNFVQNLVKQSSILVMFLDQFKTVSRSIQNQT